MDTFTIITKSETFTVDGSHWARDDDGSLYVYPSDNDDSNPVAEVEGPEFIAIFDAQHGTHAGN